MSLRWFNNLKISSKLLTGFLLVCMVGGVAGLVGIVNIRKIGQADAYLYESVTVPATQLGQLDANLNLVQVHCAACFWLILRKALKRLHRWYAK